LFILPATFGLFRHWQSQLLLATFGVTAAALDIAAHSHTCSTG
jgi:hypothetical protein